MNKTIEEFRVYFDDTVESVENYCIFVRDRKLQAESITKLEGLLKECVENKERATSNLQEDAANAFLAFEYATHSLIEHFKFYLALKDGEADKAWDHLINAEQAAANAMKSHEVAAHLTDYVKHLHTLEHIFFPKPAFISTGWVVQESLCNICDSEYGVCDHIKGRAYMGKLCARIIKKGLVKEVSIVSDPADKHCRVLHFSEGEICRNAFTHEIVHPEIGKNASESK